MMQPHDPGDPEDYAGEAVRDPWERNYQLDQQAIAIEAGVDPVETFDWFDPDDRPEPDPDRGAGAGEPRGILNEPGIEAAGDGR